MTPPLPSPPPGGETPYRILVVDDSPTQALLLQNALEEQGWSVLVAPDPTRALELLSKEELDLVVVDYYLPGIQGDELCRLIRMNVDTRNLPLLMLTVADDDQSQRIGLESGADDYLPKSVETEVLLVRIRALLRKSLRPQRILSGEMYFGKGRLLVVDDSLTYREYLTLQLTAEGYTVVAAAGAEEARDSLARQSFDVVLVDLVMPQVDGIELCRELNQMRISLRNPFAILMLTAHEGKEEMTRGLEAGADDFIGKSCDSAVLRARLRALLRRKFFQEENLRISRELKEKELETLRAQAEKEAFQERAALAGQLERANRELEETNRKLKQTQVQLVQSAKMASLGQLVAGIAHEMNNPVAFVFGNHHSIEKWLEQLHARLRDQLSPESQALWRKILKRMGANRQGLERLKDLVLKLRTFSRLDEGEFDVADVHQGLESVLALVNHRLKGRIRIVRDYCQEGLVGCFPGVLNQVFMNLVSNAADAITGRGVITLSTSRDEQGLTISVSDTGTGIAPEDAHRIFEPFFTTKPVGEGMGLGLAISYSIVQAHHGRIEVRSSGPGGTTLSVWLPLDLERRLRAG